MEGFCRACLIQNNDHSELLQYNEKNRRLFIYSTGIQVKHNDTITFQLCKDCYFNMSVSCKFKKMCRNSDKKLRNYLAFKGAGENIDFTTFLKNSDDSLFRLPMSGNSPGINKIKDEDNESTCTSIQNFISDLMESDEIPTTDSRIIREVIEEEPDILDDSLDSHWLEDEDFVSTEHFKLDFSFSPFLTPRHIKEDHCYTPKKLRDELSIEKSLMLFKNNKPSDEVCQQFIEQNFVNTKDFEQQCTIDRNLEKALQNEKNENFFLHDLLVTPPFCPNMSGPPTPMITNILFGDKLDTDIDGISMQKVGHCIESFKPLQGDNEILEEFFAEDNKETKLEEEEMKQECKLAMEEEITIKNKSDDNDDIKIKDEVKPVSPNEAKFSITNFYCKMCNKQFKTLTALKVHCSRLHKLKINYKNPYIRKIRICDHCGKSYYHLAQFIKHIKTHSEPPQRYVCKYCSLKFSSDSKLRMHMTTHIGKVSLNTDKEKKKFVCTVCGAFSTSATNLKTHLRRHSKNYTIHCKECGRGFYRKSDFTTHYRHHTGEKPFPCQYCKRRFARRDVLNRHMKCHTDEKPFECKFCNQRYAKMTELRAHLDKGKLCLQKRSQQYTEEQPIKDAVSVIYATVVGTNIYLDNLKDQARGN